MAPDKETWSRAPKARLGDFEVIRPLGRGGMAEVYLARDLTLGRRVALKLIREEALDTQDVKDRFLQEARTTARFSHPHIVTIHTVAEQEGTLFLALEYLDGRTLRARLEEGALGRQEALRIAVDITSALAEAHRHGVLHRDLKPENVMIGGDGRLRVLRMETRRRRLAAGGIPGTNLCRFGLDCCRHFQRRR